MHSDSGLRRPDDETRRPATGSSFCHRTGVWDLSQRPRVVGILNLTPDSFYDGGRYATVDAALKRAEQMLTEGAHGIDLGGQSTRPGSRPIDAEEEWRRVGAPLVAIAKTISVIPLSIDTYFSEVARRALDAGASMVNDVSGLTIDPSIADVVARAGAGLVIMHSIGGPKDLHVAREYGDVAQEIRDFLRTRARLAEEQGVSREHIAIDPGVGFSKRAEQSFEALRGIPRYRELGYPVYVGVSRKSFLAARTGEPVERRLPAGLAATVAAYGLGARIFRTHDVLDTVEALRTAQAVLHPVAVEVSA